MATFTVYQNDADHINGQNSNFKMAIATPVDNGWQVLTQYLGLNSPKTQYLYKNRADAFVGLCQLLASDN